MKQTHKDIANWDYLDIFVKNNNFEEVKSSYQDFGWIYVKHQQDSMYDNVQVVHFKRSHTIKNKDELQFLQVGLDNTLIKKGYLEKTKHNPSIICGITLGLLCALLLLTPVILNFNYAIFNFWTILCGSVGFLLTGFTIWFILHLTKKEKLYFAKKQDELNQKICAYREQAKNLCGGQISEERD